MTHPVIYFIIIEIFDSALKPGRDFIHYEAGKTLDEAIQAWESARKESPAIKEIGAQFEYNRQIREYFKQHSDGTLSDAISS